MSKTTGRARSGGIVQQAWKPSVVMVGDRITGTCVSVGGQYTGTVAEVFGPIRSPDCGGYRYKLTDTGQFYGDGNPVEPFVFASAWADDSADRGAPSATPTSHRMPVLRLQSSAYTQYSSLARRKRGSSHATEALGAQATLDR